MPSMTLQELELQTKKEEMRFNCSLMVGHVRVEIALKWCGKQDDEDRRMTPLVWLRQNWEKKVGSLLAQNTIFSRQEITEALQDCGFDDIKLTEKLKLMKRAKIEEMRVDESYTDSDLEQFLLEAQGDKSKAICAMQRNMLRPFLHRLETGNHERPSMKSFIEITTESRAKNAFAAYFNCDNDVILGMMFHILHHKGTDGNDFLSECSMADVMEAALSYPADVSEAIDFLRNECKICFKMFPKSKIECMSTCTDIGCKYCRSCLHQYLRHKINDTPRHVRDIVCPVCLQPDMEADEEMTTNYLNHLDALVRRGLDHETHQLFQKKLRDQALMKMPNFRWCSHCDNGFLYEQPDVLKMICSSCRKATCYSCKKPWEDQHEGISCQEFLQWKAMNDPDFQAAGLAAHLQEHGIDCPNCKFRYALAKGGCMHFKCSTCSFEFCSGCKASFKQGRNCAVLTTCHNKGLHAHHPRDCLFYLRDFEVGRLQTILEEAHVGFDTESTTSNNTCQVMELRETVDGLVDACCEGEVHDNNADLCELHYKEYLVNLINSHRLDPVSVFTAEELKVCLQREEHPIPVPDDEDYHEELLHLVRAFPLIHQMQR